MDPPVEDRRREHSIGATVTDGRHEIRRTRRPAGCDDRHVDAARDAPEQLRVEAGARPVAIDARRDAPLDGSAPTWTVVVKGGREATTLDAVSWAQRAVELGAGELLVTSIDRDGTGAGFDTELLRAISGRVTVPVIASGGAAGPDDFVAAVRDGGADAVLAASIFHRRIHSIAEVKRVMAEAGIPVRAVA